MAALPLRQSPNSIRQTNENSPAVIARRGSAVRAHVTTNTHSNLSGINAALLQKEPGTARTARPARPREKGFSLVEVMIALAVSGAVILAMTQISLMMAKQQSQSVMTSQLNILHNSIVQALNSAGGWTKTAGDSRNHTDMSGSGGPLENMFCQIDPAKYCSNGSATTTQMNWTPIVVLLDSNGAETLNMGNATNGINMQGQACTGFVTMPGMRGYTGGATPPPGNDACPLRYEILWQAQCGGAGPACNNKPQATLTVTLYYNPGTRDKMVGFNPDNYSSRFNQGSTGAQCWVYSAGGLYETCGNVGIRTTTPMAPLHVVTDRTGGAVYPLIVEDGPNQTATTLFGFWPGIGFNYIHDGTSPMVFGANKYAAEINLNPNVGTMNFKFWDKQTTAKTATTLLSTPLTLTYTGNVGIGTSAPNNASLHVVQDGSSGSAPVRAERMSSDNGGGAFVGGKARGTVVAPSVALAGDRLTGLYGYGYDGTPTWNNANYGAIQIFAAENVSTTAKGTYINFETTLSGTTTRSERMRIASNGNVGIGTSNPSVSLDVVGTPPNVRTRVSNSTNGNTTNIVQLVSDPTDAAYLHIRRDANNEWFLQADPAANTLNFKRANLSSNPSLSITTGGNVGIGTTAPERTLHVNGHTLLDNGTIDSPNLILHDSSQGVGGVAWNVDSANGSFRIFSEPITALGPLTTSSGIARLSIATNGLVTLNGSIGIPTNSRFAALNSSGAYRNIANIDSSDNLQIGDTIGIQDIIFYNNGAERIRIDSSGNLINSTGGFWYTSDRRAKRDITNISDEKTTSVTDRLKNIIGVYFRYIKDANTRRIGVIAQDVQKEFPELVHTDKDGKLSVDYLGFIGVLIEAIKEQAVRLTSSEKRIEALESENQQLKSRLDEIELKLNSLLEAK